MTSRPSRRKRGHHARPHHGRLARAGGADHGEHASGAELLQTRVHVVGASEERVRVVGVVGEQAAVRAHRARLRQRRVLEQRRILAQHRLLELGELRARVDAQVPVEHLPDPAQGDQRLVLLSGLVLRQREQRPASLAQRLLVHQGLGASQHLLRVP